MMPPVTFKVLRLLCIICLTASFFPPRSLAAEGDKFDWPDQSPMTFRLVTTGGNCSSCKWIAAEGAITLDTPDKFKEFIGKNSNRPGSTFIRLNSIGGNLLAGMKLGELIRSNGFNTVVGKTVGKEDSHGVIWTTPEDPTGHCVSACVFAFAGGVQRYAVSTSSVGFAKTGRIGVHQFYDERALAGIDRKIFDALDRSADQVIVALILEHLTRVGVSAELVAIASTTPWQSVRWLSDTELKKTKLDNANVSAGVRLVGYKNGVATATIEFNRADAAYEIEIYCDAARQMLLKAKIRSRDPVDPQSVKAWALYDDLTMSNGIKLKKVRMSISGGPEGGSDLEILFRFLGTEAKSLVDIKEFRFEDGSSRYASEAAAKLSFRLPSEFDGLHVLPRTCTRS